MKKSALLPLIATALAFDVTNPYTDLPDISYSGSKPVRKTNLTKKQKKARAKSKSGRKASRKNKR